MKKAGWVWLTVGGAMVVFTFLRYNARTKDTVSGWDDEEQYESEREVSTQAQQKATPGSGFRPFRTEHGVHTLHNLCIEVATNSPVTKEIPFPKKLVVYGAKKPGVRSLLLNTGPYDAVKRIRVQFEQKPLPQDYSLITEYPAYFVTTTRPGNWHHVLCDTAVGLFELLRKTHRLNSTTKNQLYNIASRYNIPDFKAFHEIFYALGMRKELITIHQEKPKVCYQNAAFGFFRKKNTYADLARYLKRHFKVDRSTCGPPPTVTIIQRPIRTIANVEELINYVKQQSWIQNIKSYNFGTMTLKEQAQVIICTDVLVGVQGAGLEWIYFMKRGRGLLELSWLKHHWKYIYAGLARRQGLVADTQEATNVSLNWEGFRQKGEYRTWPVSEEARAKLAAHPGIIYEDTNPWKFADGFFDKKRFRNKLLSLVRRITVR